LRREHAAGKDFLADSERRLGAVRDAARARRQLCRRQVARISLPCNDNGDGDGPYQDQSSDHDVTTVRERLM